MASQKIIAEALKLYKKLGGNPSKILGSRTNVNFLGKGDSPDPMLDQTINVDALNFLYPGKGSKLIEEFDNSMGYLTSGKLNDVQAGNLLNNLRTVDNYFNPPPGPANITDMVTGTRNLDKEGIMTLRRGGDPTKYKPGDPITSENFAATGFAPDNTNLRRARELSDDIDVPRGVGVQRVPADEIADDLPPPGSRGGPDDIAAPFSGAGLEAIKNVKGSNLIVDDIVDKIYMNAGVTKAAQPVARANAREFLNRVKDLEDPANPGGPSLATIMEVDDFKFMTEGGGGGMGDPMLLVQKYFGPKVASSVAQLDNADDIQKFAERLVGVKDARGNTITSRSFDPDTVDPDDFEFADGGRVPFFAGMLVGAARGGKMGYQALRKYGIEGKDISRLFASLGTDKSLVGKEKTEYFKMLNKVLRNPDDYPDEIMDIQKQLGLDVGLGFRNGGLAGILEV